MAQFNPTPIQTELAKLPSISDQYAIDAYTPSKPAPPLQCRPGNWSVQATPINDSTHLSLLNANSFSTSGDNSFACSNELDDSFPANKIKLLAVRSSACYPDEHEHDVDDECASNDSFRSISESSQSSDDHDAYTASDIARIADQVSLKPHGLAIVDVLRNTMTGCVYEGKLCDRECKEDNDSGVEQQQQQPRVVNGVPLYRKSSLKCFSTAANSAQQPVCITKVDKQILEFQNKYGGGDCSTSNISKECLILHYLTVLNKPPADNIISFVDFIETDLAYYLVREHEPTYISLSQFIEQAHMYIREKKLKLKHWRITAKFIFWQLISTLYWLHNDMNTCCLRLDADHILVGNANFLVSKQDGSVQIDSRQLNVKLTQFEYAEVFKAGNHNNHSHDDEPFLCHKSGSKKQEHGCRRCPQAYSGQIFDAKKDDTYQLGVILFSLLTGCSEITHEAYLALQRCALKQYVESNALGKHINRDALSLLESLLNIDEEERLDTKQTIAHEWLQHYYARYKSRIQQKSKSQQQRHVRQKQKIAMMPFYALPQNTKHCSL